MADLSLTFENLYDEVLKFLGTYNSDSPGTTDLADAKFITNRAYNRFCSYFDWTFLYQEKTLETVSGVYKYPLSSDFSYLVYPKLSFDDDDGYTEIQQRTPGQIKEFRSGAVYNNAPMYFALQAGAYYKETGQGWEIWFYPTPDAVYHLQYLCKINPQKLVEDADIPIGGADMSEVLLELCLAYAEVYKDEVQAVNSQIISQILGPAKIIDNKRRSSYLGNLGMVSNLLDIDIENRHHGNVIVSS